MFALFVAAPSPVRADYRSAVSAYENDAYEAALGEFRTLAQSGDPAAVGSVYLVSMAWTG